MTTTHKIVRARLAGPVWGLAITGLAAVGLGVVVYFASTSIAWFATSPTSDPNFGALNGCLMQQVPAGRVGFAVSTDSSHAATFSDRGLGVCAGTSGRFVELPGITRAAWDHRDNLWIAASSRLLRLSEGAAPEPVGDLAPVALAGHAEGVAVLEKSGRVVSLSDDGSVLGVFDLPTKPDSGAELVADASGELLAVLTHASVWFLRARDLSLVEAQSPCDAQYLWWTPEPGRAVVACGPDQSWALTWAPQTNTREEAPRREREPSTLVARSGVYVRGCEGLPCTAPSP